MDMFYAITRNALPTPLHTYPSSSSTLATHTSSRSILKRPPVSDISISESLIKRPRYFQSGTDTNDITQPSHRMSASSSAVELSSTLRSTSVDADDSTPDDDDHDDVSLKFFSSVPMNKLSTSSPSYIMDSGAGRTGTSHLHLLKNVQPNANTTVSGAFGPSVHGDGA